MMDLFIPFRWQKAHKGMWLMQAARRTCVCTAGAAGLGVPAKTTLFAGGNEGDVRKMAEGHFSN
jgi:hypothetical protein